MDHLELKPEHRFRSRSRAVEPPYAGTIENPPLVPPGVTVVPMPITLIAEAKPETDEDKSTEPVVEPPEG
jgi:hypothetical protein